MDAPETESGLDRVPKDVSIGDILGSKDTRLALNSGVGIHESILLLYQTHFSFVEFKVSFLG